MATVGKIGTFAFAAFTGQLRESTRDFALRTRPGVNGTGVLRGSWRVPPSEIMTYQTCADEPAARQLAADYRNLMGTAVAVIDSAGRSYPGTVVLRAVPTCYPRVAGTGGSSDADTYEVACRWVLLPAYTTTAQGGLSQ